MKRINFILTLIAFTIVISSCSKLTRLQKSSNIDEKFNGAIEFYNNKKYFECYTLLEEIVPLLRGTEMAEQAAFYLAKSHYSAGDLVEAAYLFQDFYETFPRSQYAEEAQYYKCLALYETAPRYYLDQSTTEKAMEAFQTYLLVFPNSTRKDAINGYINAMQQKLERKAFDNAKLYHLKENHQAAVIALENFRKEYPDSEFNEEAAYLRIETMYQYASNSIESKKPDRYRQMVEFYEKFLDKYPSSKYLGKAERFYVAAQSELKKP